MNIWYFIFIASALGNAWIPINLFRWWVDEMRCKELIYSIGFLQHAILRKEAYWGWIFPFEMAMKRMQTVQDYALQSNDKEFLVRLGLEMRLLKLNIDSVTQIMLYPSAADKVEEKIQYAFNALDVTQFSWLAQVPLETLTKIHKTMVQDLRDYLYKSVASFSVQYEGEILKVNPAQNPLLVGIKTSASALMQYITTPLMEDPDSVIKSMEKLNNIWNIVISKSYFADWERMLKAYTLAITELEKITLFDSK